MNKDVVFNKSVVFNKRFAVVLRGGLKKKDSHAFASSIWKRIDLRNVWWISHRYFWHISHEDESGKSHAHIPNFWCISHALFPMRMGVWNFWCISHEHVQFLAHFACVCDTADGHAWDFNSHALHNMLWDIVFSKEIMHIRM